MSKEEKADVVIVGGGIFGCAIAYYYTRNNPGKKLILLERNELCNAATSRAAALMTIVRSKKAFVPLSLETCRVIPQLEQQLGESLGMKTVGMMHVAASEKKVKELECLMGISEEFGIKAVYLSKAEARRRSPWLRVDEALRIGFVEGEAYCDPYLLGTFYARCAKLNGADIRQGVAVEQLLQENNRVTGVQTAAGKVLADKIVIATGVWAPILARQAGICLPVAPVRSQYWITEKADIFPVNSPVVLLPDAHAYARPEGGSLLFGIRERNSFVVSPVDIPSDISGFRFSPDNGQADLSEVIESLGRFFPAVYDIGLRHYIAGFSGYTPDTNLTIGAVKGNKNILFATGCVGAGIALSGGVGLGLAELAAGRSNPFDFADFSISRFGDIDPLGKEWLGKCGQARSSKVSG